MMMSNKRIHILVIAALAGAPGCEPKPDATPDGDARQTAIHGAAATAHPLADRAAERAMAKGGNAVDGAVAAALTLNVVRGYHSGIGGGCFILVRTADGKRVAIDGRETAPAEAHRDMYVRDGEVRSDLSTAGPLASGTPGALAAYKLAVSKHGNLTLAELLRPAAELAERGYEVDPELAGRIEKVADTFHQNEAAREIFFGKDDEPLEAGDTLTQPGLARTFRKIANNGIGWFYEGAFARRCAEWMEAHGGVLSEKDFARYEAKRRDPVVSQYLDHTVLGFPPPSSGGTHVAQVLNILKHFELAKMERAERYHVIAEAMKLAFADRAHWLGDSDFEPVPKGLVSQGYADRLAERIRLDRAIEVNKHGTPPAAKTDLFGKHHTSHLSVADERGNWAAITATINFTFGSKEVIPGTGVVMNNEMNDFSLRPGVPNAYGLVGAEANAVEPGKRPLSSMAPTIVLRDGRPRFSCGAAGGPTIINQVVLTIVRRVALGRPLQQAVAAPRIHHQWKPDQILAERKVAPPVIDRLKQLGHKIERADKDGIGISQAVGRRGERFITVRDPRTSF